MSIRMSSELDDDKINDKTGTDTTDHAHVDSDYDELDIPDPHAISKITDSSILIETNEKESTENRIIPFSVVHNPAVKFKSLHRNIFIPGVDIKVQIIQNERSVTTHLLNPNLYTIQFNHGDYTWTVTKRYKHIQYLHQQLRLFRTSLNIPFPTKSHKERRTSFKNNKDGSGKSSLPRFPSKPDALVPFEQLDIRRRELEEYLRNLLNIPLYRNHEETIKFLEVSHLSFVGELGAKGKEGLVRKRTGSTRAGQSGCDCFGWVRAGACVRCSRVCQELMCARWRTRWLFVKETCFGYVHPKDGQIHSVVLFDQCFEAFSSPYTGARNAIQITTSSRQLFFKCWTKRKSKEWLQYLRNAACEPMQARDFTQPNPHGSFAPVRANVRSAWFIDGADYMSAVADAIDAAQEEIFITDWWLSPEIYLKRKTITCEDWRLDRLLRKKAQQGVRVFVLLYKEVEMALGINSFYSKSKLTEGTGAAADNIKVLRHPDHAKAGVFLWAHHEKLVVVDQSYAFVGGIDLCYGRWDDAKHRLTDLGSVSLTKSSGPTKKKTSSTPTDSCFFPPKGIPIHPASLPSLPEPDIVVSSAPESEPEPELPALHPGDSLLIGPPPFDAHRLKCNTPEPERRSTFDKLKDNVTSKGKDLINLIYTPDEDQQATAIVPKVTNISQQSDIDELDGSAKLWIGKDYTNFIVKDFANLDAPYVDLVDRNSTPRMPWHDIAMYCEGAAARDVARHFVQRWNAVKLEKARCNSAYPYLLPKSYNVTYPRLAAADAWQTQGATCQVLRSAAHWSVGFLDPDTVEQSIHEAYIDSIRQSQHYIYIENQFFVTLSGGGVGGAVHNQIGDALFERITRAHREKSVFRVYVVMPLLPGFEGEIGGPTGTALLAVTHWNYASISRGEHSLLARLRNYGITDTNAYINFYGLRTHSMLDNEPVTELIYVHSKLMIVDDRLVICGSANINDRSLVGGRDSELAVLIRDELFDEGGQMNGEPYASGKFAGGLRKRLFQEHLGLLPETEGSTRPKLAGYDVTDPVCDAFYLDTWHRIAVDNTNFYEKVFHCLPADEVESFAALRRRQELPPLYHSEVSRAAVMLDSIEGHLVLLPLHFLESETLTPSGTSVEGIMPTSLWT